MSEELTPKQRLHFVAGKWRHLQAVKQSSPNRVRRASLAMSAAPLPRRSNDNKSRLGLRVEDQSNVGACAAEAFTSVMEAAILITLGIRVQLAALWLYFYVRLYAGTPPEEDSGCDPADVVVVINKAGCALDSSWPFDADKFSEQPPASLDSEAALHRGLLDFECETDEQTKHSLIQGFPVCFALDVPNKMMTEEVAQHGLVAHTTPDDFAGRHMIVAVDFDDDMEIDGDVGGYLCLNSWSLQWGLEGYFWVSYKCRPTQRYTIRRVGAA